MAKRLTQEAIAECDGPDRKEHRKVAPLFPDGVYGERAEQRVHAANIYNRMEHMIQDLAWFEAAFKHSHSVEQSRLYIQIAKLHFKVNL